MFKKLIVLTSFVLALAVTGAASADEQAITVPDAGFDDHVLSEGGYAYLSDGDYTGAWKSHAVDQAWIDYGYWAADGDLPALSGNNKAYGNDGGSEDYIYQILDETFIEGATYTLSVWIGQAWEGYDDSWSLYFTGDDYTDELVSIAGNGPIGEWGQASLVYTATAADAGKKIGIKMQGATYVTFEDVTLSVSTPEPVKVDMEIGFAMQAPVLDGEVDEIWADASTQSFVPLQDPVNGSGTWKALYDAENLYVIVDVTDDSLQNDSASSWQDDSVEIYFDGGNTKLDTPLSGDDHQYTLGWTTEEIQGTNIDGYTEGIEHAQVDTDTGWRIEVKMPWLSIWGVSPQAGDLIGIDCYYNDDDDGGDSRENKMLGFSAVEGWNDASQWATAILMPIPTAKDPIPADGAAGISPAPPLSTFISADVPMDIPDAGWYDISTATATLEVTDSLTITDLNVELDIDHSKNNADLDVYLIGPDGTQVELFTDVGLWEKGFKNTILDQQAGTSIKNGSGKFTGRFNPRAICRPLTVKILRAHGSSRFRMTGTQVTAS